MKGNFISYTSINLFFCVIQTGIHVKEWSIVENILNLFLSWNMRISATLTHFFDF